MAHFARGLLFLLLTSSPAFAQKEAFVAALVQLVTALDGTTGDEGPAVLDALRAMDDGLRQWDRAIAAAEAGLAAQVGSATPDAAARMRTALGLIYLERGRFGDALAQLDMAAALAPARADVQLFRAWALRGAGRAGDAADAFHRAFERDPTNPLVAYLVVHQSRDGTPPGEGVARARAATHAAEALLDGGADAARRFLTPALLDDAAAPEPLFAWAAYADGYALLARARYAEAIAALRAAAASDPLVARSVLASAHGRAGAAAMKAGHATGAIAAFAAAVQESPDSSEARRMLGLAYRLDRQYAKSAEQLEAAIRLAPLDERARLALADVHMTAGAPLDAERVLLDATGVLPRSGQAQWQLGRVYRALSRDADAIPAFEAAAAAGPIAGAAALQVLIGQLQENHFAWDAAVDAFVLAIDVNPNDAAAHRELGEAYLAQDRLEEARTEFVLALLIDPSDVPAWVGLGQIHAAGGRLEQALTALRRAAALQPGHREARYALARTLMRLGREAEGRAELAAYEELQRQQMADERRRFDDTLRRIEEAVESSPPAGAQR